MPAIHLIIKGKVPGDNEDNSESGFLLDGKKHKKDDDNRDQLPTTWNIIDGY